MTHRNRSVRRWTAICALVVVGLVATGCTGMLGSHRRVSEPAPRPTASAPSTPAPFPTDTGGVHREDGIVYRTVDGQDLTVNACLPRAGSDPVPAVLVIHGGGFRAGSNDGAEVTRVCEQLARAGFAGFSVAYRLAPEHPYPAAVQDLQAAVAWLREPAQTTRFRIDPDRIGAFGSSAGGNLAMELATVGEGDLTTGSRIAAAVSLSGPTDMTAAALNVGHPPADRIAVALQYLGCASIDDCPAAQGASPRYQVDSTDAALFLAHSRGERIPVEQARVMAAAMTAAGVPVTTKLLPGSAHGLAYLDASLWHDIVDFLDAHLRG